MFALCINFTADSVCLMYQQFLCYQCFPHISTSLLPASACFIYQLHFCQTLASVCIKYQYILLALSASCINFIMSLSALFSSALLLSSASCLRLFTYIRSLLHVLLSLLTPGTSCIYFTAVGACFMNQAYCCQCLPHVSTLLLSVFAL